jgi:hypothetical protein
VTTWHAESTQDLAEIAGVIHDSWFDIDDVEHHATAQTLVIPFAQEWDGPPLRDDPEWRDAPKPEPTRTTWRYREEHVPFMRGVLRIAAVEAADIDRHAGDAAMLLDTRYDADTRLVTVEGVSGDLRARVQQLDVTAELVNEVALVVRRRRGLLGGASDTPLWDWSR